MISLSQSEIYAICKIVVLNMLYKFEFSRVQRLHKIIDTHMHITVKIVEKNS